MSSKQYLTREDRAILSGPLAEAKVLAASRLAQSWADAFRRDGRAYSVAFGDVQTAATDFKRRRIEVAADILADESLPGDALAGIIGGMTAHEITHDRYGSSQHGQWVQQAQFSDRLPHNRVPHTLSNLLDDAVGEASFGRDYPGHAGIFKPVLDYVVRRHPPSPQTLTDPMQRAIAAVRYAGHFDWRGHEQDRDWWQAWAKRHAAAGTDEAAYVAAITEGTARIAQQQSEQQQGEGEPGEGEGQPGEQSGAGQPGEGNPMQAQEAPGREGDLASCLADALADAMGDATPEQQHRMAEAMAEAASANDVRVVREIKPQRAAFEYQSGIAGAIRRVFLTERSSRVGAIRSQRRGVLDTRNLHRIAEQDYRIFARRGQQSSGKFLVYLMIDCSSSMAWEMRHAAASITRGIAEASRGLGNLEVRVYGWTSGRIDGSNAEARAACSIGELYARGKSPANISLALASAGAGGTPDGMALRWAIKDAREQAGNATPVVVMLSDGRGEGEAIMSRLATDARKRGVQVLSVALAASIDAAYQTAVYGRGNFIAWPGSMAALAAPLASMLGRIVRPGGGY